MSFISLCRKITAKPYWWVYLVGVLVLITAAVIGWFMVYLGPQRVFWRMAETSLQTSSVTLKTEQKKDKGSLEQIIQVDTSQGKARSLTTLKEDKTEIITEVIGTKDADYTRYVRFNPGTKADTSMVQNVWAKIGDDPAATPEQASAGGAGQRLYAQAALGTDVLGSVPIPVGKVTVAQQKEIYQYMRDSGVYTPSFSKVKKERKDGRLLYTYDVKIQTILYVTMMKAFAKDLGLHDLDAAEPNSYVSNPTIMASVTVDALSHRLTAVNFPKLGYSRLYQAYSQPVQADIPQKYITSAELQKRLDALKQP